MAGVWASLWCVFGHKWRWMNGASFDHCIRCEDAVRPHVPGTKEDGR